MILGELLPKSDKMPFDLVNKVMPVKESKTALTYDICKLTTTPTPRLTEQKPNLRA